MLATPFYRDQTPAKLTRHSYTLGCTKEVAEGEHGGAI